MNVYKCLQCGNMIQMMKESGIPVMCCGKKMEQLVPNTVEASEEKHIPVIDVNGNRVTVTVGSVEHPMETEHYIEWICLETKNGEQYRQMKPGDTPTATFVLEDDEVVAAYAYCNLHGFWKAELEEKLVCDLKPLDVNTNENYVVCKCNNVSYFDILDEVHKHSNIENLLEVFEEVKNTTHCSTGCGGCYDKVIAIISDSLTTGKK